MTPPIEKTDSRLMREMFHAIAPHYDLVTRALSYGMDRAWKREALECVHLTNSASILDLACGTGDFSKLIARKLPDANAVAADLTHNMLRHARNSGIERAVCADALRLPFRDGCFDAVFVGYGMRNFPDLEQALCEIGRVLRPGGLLVSLDFFLPRPPLLRWIYLRLLFLQGAIWGLMLHARPRMYTYIAASLGAFVSAQDFSKMLEKSGYTHVRERTYLAGGIALHWAARGRA